MKKSGKVLVFILGFLCFSASACVQETTFDDPKTDPAQETAQPTVPAYVYELGDYEVGDSGVYDITEFFEDYGTIKYVYMDGDIPVAIYEETTEEGKIYSKRAMDLQNGRTYSYEDAVTAEETDIYPTFISVDPLVVSSTATATVYTQDGTIKEPDEDCAANYVICEDGEFYYVYGSFILKEDGNGGFEKVFETPAKYFDAYPSYRTGNETILFEATDDTDDYGDVYFEVTPDGNTERTYTSDDWVEQKYDGGDNLCYWDFFEEDGYCISIGDKVTHDLTTKKMPKTIWEAASSNLLGDDATEEDWANALYERTSPYALGQTYFIFALIDINDDVQKIYIWNYAEQTPEANAFDPEEGTTDFEVTGKDYGEVSDFAEELEEKYGVTIAIGQNIRTHHSYYTLDTCEDGAKIEYALEGLDRTLGAYPEGFLEQLSEISARTLEIHLCGTISPSELSEYTVDNANAFSSEIGQNEVLVFDIANDFFGDSTVYHELAHTTDHKLWRDGFLDEDWWSAMNPGGFTYYNLYRGQDGEAVDADDIFYTYWNLEGSADDVYFIDNYSKTYSTEDRATLMEYYLSGLISYEEFSEYPHLKEKLDAYLDLVDEAFAVDFQTEFD